VAQGIGPKFKTPVPQKKKKKKRGKKEKENQTKLLVTQDGMLIGKTPSFP
jgi:hypothetical protein